MGEVLTRMTARRSLAQIRYVAPVWPRDATGLVAGVYAQIQRDFGMVAPPVALHAGAPSTLAACWLMLRETLLATGTIDRATKEAVAAAVSLRNACPYCVDVHSALLGGLVRGRDAGAIAADRVHEVRDPRLREIAAWVRAGGRAPLSVPAVAEVVGVAVTFHYLNRMVNVFLGDSPLPAGAPDAVRGGVRWLLGRVMRPIVAARRPPGTSLDLLPPAPPDREPPWAAGSPHIAGAFARATEAVRSAGERALPPGVRALVRDRLAGWDGEPLGPGRGWVTDAVAGLPPAQRPAGRLALLTAMASYQVDGAVVEDFRGESPDDGALLAAASWASLAASLHLGARLATVASTMDAPESGTRQSGAR